MCLTVCLHVFICACLMLTRPKYGVGSSGIGVMDGLDILCDAQN